MYKLFLTFRYLTRKKIVIFPILVVWLCVMMLIIVSSIMQGFVDRVRDANRDLFGDIIISSPSSSQGFEGYDALAASLKAAPFGKDILATTPVVETYALLYVPSAQTSVPALLVGVRPEERSQVTQFRQSLFQQYQAPTQAADTLAERLPATRAQLIEFADRRADDAARENQTAFAAYAPLLAGTPAPTYANLILACGIALVALLAVVEWRWRAAWWILLGFILGPLIYILPQMLVPEFAAFTAQHAVKALTLPWTCLLACVQLAAIVLLGRRLFTGPSDILAKIGTGCVLLLAALTTLAGTAALLLPQLAPAFASRPEVAWSGFYWWVFEGAAAGLLLALLAKRAQRHVFWNIFSVALLVIVGLSLVALDATLASSQGRIYKLAKDRYNQSTSASYQAERVSSMARALADKKYDSRDELVAALRPAKPSFDLPATAKVTISGQTPLPGQGCIVGAQIGFNERDTRGNFIHAFPDDFRKVSITVFPPSKNGNISVQATNAVTEDFTIVDDSHTGVYDVDSLNVYADFDTVQLMAGMSPDPRLGAEGDFPKRAHQLLIRLKPEAQGRITELRDEIDRYVRQNASFEQRILERIQVQTWDEKQAKYLGAVENEKSMMSFILLLMSCVVLVVIFLIFYMIVRDKTRDIGIVKAVGGSELGVAGIFLSYGLMIGAVGGGLGVLAGWIFVSHTNEIHEWIFQTTGIVIWDRSVYLFDRIPDVASPNDVALYYVIALAAGVIGATIPALLAAMEDPVQAVRYE